MLLLLLLLLVDLDFVTRLVDEERKVTVAVLNIVIVAIVVFHFLLSFAISVSVTIAVVPVSVVALLVLRTTLWIGLAVDGRRLWSRRRRFELQKTVMGRNQLFVVLFIVKVTVVVARKLASVGSCACACAGSSCDVSTSAAAAVIRKV